VWTVALTDLGRLGYTVAMPPKRPLWQDWRLDSDEQAEFRAKLAAGDLEALQRFEGLRAEALEYRLVELSRQFGDRLRWRRLATSPADFSARLKALLKEIESTLRALWDVPTARRPIEHAERDRLIFNMRRKLDVVPGKGKPRVVTKEIPFATIARVLNARHEWQLTDGAVREAYARELGRREKRLAELALFATEALADSEDT
jgi:hypothetical protein